MKFYNPFKAHVVQLATGGYAVRKLNCFLYFGYLDSNSWFYGFPKWYSVDTEQEARKMLADYRNNTKAKIIYQ